nr:hypothetical protein BaRGS_016295 [Batillaria attramentaria]
MLSVSLWLDPHALLSTLADNQRQAADHRRHVILRDTAILLQAALKRGNSALTLATLGRKLLAVIIPGLRDAAVQRYLNAMPGGDGDGDGAVSQLYPRFSEYLGWDGRLLLALTADYCGPLAAADLTNHLWLRWLSLNSNFLQGLEEGTFTGLAQLVFLDLSSNKLLLHYDAYPRGVFDPLTSLQELQLQYNDDSLETLALSGNYCYNISEEIFDNLQSVRELRMSDVNLNPHFFRTRAWRIFQKLELLQTLDLSLNNLIHVDPDMLRAQRHLKELVLAGNRLQSLSVNLEPHRDLELLDLSHNMLPTLLPVERQALDKLASGRIFRLRLRGNPLLCACSNLDFVRWLWSTAVEVDGDGNVTRNYTCVTDSGEISDTHSVMMHYDFHWRRCVGQTMLGAASAAFLLQLLVLVIVYVVSRSWTHLRYLWKVMKRLRLPRREHFRWDAYVGYAHADREFACLMLPACLEERHGVRLLLRDREELPGSIRAESIVEHIDESWKVLLLVTRHFATDEWACGFTVQQAQRSITDTMPDRVIVVFMEDPARLPPMASLERLLRNRLQSLSVNLEPHGDLELLDLSHNMLPTLLPAERQALGRVSYANALAEVALPRWETAN